MSLVRKFITGQQLAAAFATSTDADNKDCDGGSCPVKPFSPTEMHGDTVTFGVRDDGKECLIEGKGRFDYAEICEEQLRLTGLVDAGRTDKSTAKDLILFTVTKEALENQQAIAAEKGVDTTSGIKGNRSPKRVTSPFARIEGKHYNSVDSFLSDNGCIPTTKDKQLMNIVDNIRQQCGDVLQTILNGNVPDMSATELTHLLKALGGKTKRELREAARVKVAADKVETVVVKDKLINIINELSSNSESYKNLDQFKAAYKMLVTE